ncbi:MAG: 3-phosphoshikimate 1-carboxyvinyltransferase [Solirubrobacteraceae bacterium]
MSAYVRVSPGAVPPSWTVRVPGSKSITNRVLLLAGMAAGRSQIRAPLLADDTLAMMRALRALGVQIASQPDGGWLVDGLGGAPRGPAELYCGMGATVGRFLVPMLAAGHGQFDVDAHPQLRRRPLGPVLDALRAQGAQITGEKFPLTVHASGLNGGEITVDGAVSSQFLSGLLMAAPFARTPTKLRFGSVVSRPYLDLTFDAMRAFGVRAQLGDGVATVPVSAYTAAGVTVEPDVSTASYFLASAAITSSSVSLAGVDRRVTRQGDIELVSVLEQMGCRVKDGDALTLSGPDRLRGVTVAMGNSSDVFMTLACAAVFADGPTTIAGIGHARAKESDRIAACAENLQRLGIAVEQGPDHLRVVPGVPRPNVVLPTYEDHRVAMAFSLIGARVPVILEQPSVVGKTFPEFFNVWPVTGAHVELLDRTPDRW